MIEEKTLMEVLSKRKSIRLPIWFMRQAGRYLPEYHKIRQKHKSFIDFCLHKDSVIEVTLQPLKRFDIDAAIIFSDILLIPHALGCKVKFIENKGPVLSSLDDKKVLPSLNEDILNEKLSVVYRSLTQVRASLAKHHSLIGFVGAPWTLSAYMIEGQGSRDFQKARLWSLQNKERFKRLISLLSDACALHLINQLKAGADCVQIFESWAGCLPRSLLYDYSLAPIKNIIAQCRRAYPSAKIILFAKGCADFYEDYARHSGADAIGCDSSISTQFLSSKVQPHCVVQGTLDPLFLVKGGTHMKMEAENIVANLKKGGHIFNCGHGVLPMTPPSHLEELIDFLRSL